MMAARKIGVGPVTLTIPATYRSKELLVRWMQYSSLSDAVFRTHPGTIPNSSAQAWDPDMIPTLKTWAAVFVKGAEYRRAVSVRAGGRGEPLPVMRFGYLVWESAVWWQELDGKGVGRGRDGGGKEVVAGTDADAENTDAKNTDGKQVVAGTDADAENTDAKNTDSKEVVAGKDAVANNVARRPKLWHDDCEDGKGVLVGENQFFVGSEMLVAPVFRVGQEEKKVYLPPGPGRGGEPWTWRFLNVTSGEVGEDVTPKEESFFVTVKTPMSGIVVYYRVDAGARWRALIEESYGVVRRWRTTAGPNQDGQEIFL